MVQGEVCYSDGDGFSNIHCKHGQAAVRSGNIGGPALFRTKNDSNCMITATRGLADPAFFSGEFWKLFKWLTITWYLKIHHVKPSKNYASYLQEA